MTNTLKWPDKDPDDVLDYQVDWSGRLPTGDTISTSTWIVPAGLTKDSDSTSTKTTTIWLSGGTAGSTYSVTNRVVTTGGRTMDASVTLRLREK